MKKVFLVCSFLIGFSIFNFSNATCFPKNVNKKTYTNLQQLFHTYDSQILQSENSEEKIRYMNVKNLEILEYLKEKYPNQHLADLEIDDSAFAIYAMIFSMAEINNFQELSEEQANALRTAPDNLGCLIGAVSGLIGINDIVGIYNDIVHGVSATTIVGVLKKLLRRVTWGWTIATTIYGFGNCLGWW